MTIPLEDWDEPDAMPSTGLKPVKEVDWLEKLMQEREAKRASAKPMPKAVPTVERGA